MPIYSYRCANCGVEFEHFHRKTISESLCEVVSCPECNADNSSSDRILRGTIGLIFKGTGFYATDYKNTKLESIPSST
jgi:putative FmdB family regulatory protein